MQRLSRILIPLLAFVIFGTAFAQSYCNGGVIQRNVPWYCSEINQQLEAYWVKWAPIAILAVLVSFAIASLIFGAGVFLNNERIRNFGIGEYYEAIANAIIVGSFLFVSAVMFGLITGVATGPINPYSTALNYMTTTIINLYAELAQLFNIAALDGYYASMTFVYCGAANIACTFIPKVFKYAIMWTFYVPAFTLIDLQLESLALLYAEFWIILEFMYIAIPVFLIPGVILRSILPTRGLGGMMIAAAIGFYMLLPLLFAVAYYFTSTSTLSCTNTNTLDLQRYGAGTAAQTNALTPTSPLPNTLKNIEVCMNSYWLSVVFYPSLILALTYAVITQIAEFIGGMTKLSGRLRV